MKTKFLEGLTHDLKEATPEALKRAAQRTFGASLLVLVLPGVPLALALLLWRPLAVPLWAAVGLVLLAAALAWGALRLSAGVSRDPDLSPLARSLGEAVQLAGVPGIPALLALAFLGQPWLALALTLVAAGGYWAAWRRLENG